MVPSEKPSVFVKRRLAETRGRWPDVAKGSGVSISTIRKIGQGQIKDPAVSKIEALADYFARLDQFEASVPQVAA
ncbi:helix-turn-helix domain-containing protein [Burkholderia cenocepacia]|nr:helix-turn-helix domain-containing protein [Burkholderia cenocepacia]